MSRYWKAIIGIGLLLIWTPHFARAGQDKAGSVGKWSAWGEIGGYYDSDDASRSEVTLFAPLWQSSLALAFVEMRGKLYEADAQEGNLALGYREMLPGGWNLGVWGGSGVGSTQADNTFWQFSGGLEALHPDFDLRVNGYAALTDPQASPSLAVVKLSGSQIFMVGGEEVALHGVDGEVGVRLPLEMASVDPELVELRLYGGGFYFDAGEAIDEVAGPKARVELRFNDIVPGLPGSRLTAEYEFSHDEVRDDRHQVGARLRIPFGGAPYPAPMRYASLSAQEKRMMDPIERNTDIITAQSKDEPVEDAFTNVDFDKVAFVSGGGSISTTSTAEGDNTLLIVNGAIAGAQNLQGNQTLQGGGSTIEVRGLTSGTIAQFTAPGAVASVNNRIQLLGSNAHVAGFALSGGIDGVFVDSDKDTVLIEQLQISNAADGIDIRNNNSNVLIRKVMIEDSDEGIAIGSGNSNITIRDVSIARTVAAGEGIDIESGNTGLLIENVTMTDIGDDGIEMEGGNQVTIRNVTMNTGGQGIEIGGAGGPNTVDISDTMITYVGTGTSDGIRLAPEGSGDTVNILRTTITWGGVSTGGSSIDLDSTNSTVTITDSTLNGSGQDGLQITPDGNMVSMNNTTFLGTFTEQLVEINSAATTVSGAGNVDNSTSGVRCTSVAGVAGNFFFTTGPSCP